MPKKLVYNLPSDPLPPKSKWQRFRNTADQTPLEEGRIPDETLCMLDLKKALFGRKIPKSVRITVEWD